MRQIRIEGQNSGINDNKSNISRRVKSGILATGMMLGGVGIGAVNEAKAEIIIPGEMASQKGSVLDQLGKSVANGKAEATVGLGAIENEKKPEQIVAENIVSFLKAETPHTEEEIKSELMFCTGEKIVELGLINHGRFIQGRFIGYFETSDKENLLFFVGLKDRNKKRFVTSFRVPLYLHENYQIPPQDLFTPINSRNIISVALGLKFKNKEYTCGIFESLIAENIGVYQLKERSTGKVSVTVDVHKRFVEEIYDTIDIARSLEYGSFANGIKLNFKNPNKSFLKIKDGDIDKVTDILSNLADDKKKIISIPMTPTIVFFKSK